jgi:hypothetical protein
MEQLIDPAHGMLGLQFPEVLPVNAWEFVLVVF